METLDLEPNLMVSVLNVMFVRGGPSDVTSRRYHAHFIRMVDLAIEYYELARRDHVRAWNEITDGQRVGLAFRAISHLEISVITTRRALAALDAVVRDQGSPQIDRTQRRLIESIGGDLKDDRDCVVHVDEKLAAFVEGESHALRIDQEGTVARIGALDLSMERYAMLLRRLHEVATLLARYREGDAPTHGG